MQVASLVSMLPGVRDQFRENLRSKLISLSRNYVLGSQLGPLINQSLESGSNYQDYFPVGTPPKLRTFVEQFLDGLVVPSDERRGTDFVYEVIGSSPIEMPSGGGQLWKSFVAIEPTKKLIFDSSIAAIKVIPLPSELPDGCIGVDSVSLAEHRQLCIDFTKELAKQSRRVGALEDVAATYTEPSYLQWLKILRSQDPSLDHEWGKFRYARLLGIFRQRMQLLSVPADRIDQLVTELGRDREQAMVRHKKIGPTAQHEASAADTTVSKEKKVRELLHLAIDRMDFEQLQKIQLPFGIILDALGSNR